MWCGTDSLSFWLQVSIISACRTCLDFHDVICDWFFVITLCSSLRQGNIYIMHQMMQYGADLRLIDLQGKTSLHHAVTGGNMWVEETAKFTVTQMNHARTNHQRSFPVLQCTICGRRGCSGSQTQTCTRWHPFTWLHPQETQRWSAICSEARYDSHTFSSWPTVRTSS